MHQETSPEFPVTPNFSKENLKGRGSWTNILHTIRDNRCQPRLLYWAKLTITIDGESKVFHDQATFK